MIGTLVLLFVVAFFLSTLATWLFLRYARSVGRTAPINQRSMHLEPVAVSAGIPLLLSAIACATLFVSSSLDLSSAVLILGTIVLAIIGWIDDAKPLDWRLRLFFQIVSTLAVLIVMPTSWRIVPDYLPLVIERLILIFGWLWFTNLFNFMDGIDGLAGSGAVSISLTIVAVALFAVLPPSLAYIATALAGASAGFLIFNWHPAKVFMGDAGSIPLGYILGGLLIILACHTNVVVAAIPSLFFCFDATQTLVRRLFAGHKFFEPHREHAYQRATLGIGKPSIVVRDVLIANFLLIIATVIAVSHPIEATLLAILILATLSWRLEDLARQNSGTGEKT